MAIFIIDDHPLIRDALGMTLRRQWPTAQIVELDRLGMVAAAVLVRGIPDLICLDLKLPDTYGVSGVRELRGRYPGVPIAVFSAADPLEFEDLCIEAGADIYLEKSTDVKDVGSALRDLLMPMADAPDSAGSGQIRLTERQMQMLLMLDRGSSNREIALELGISEHTVKVHIWRLFKALGVKTRLEAVHSARVNGVLL